MFKPFPDSTASKDRKNTFPALRWVFIFSNRCALSSGVGKERSNATIEQQLYTGKEYIEGLR